ncbi:hypothetical protein R69619_07686 [Paraburkholderia nemoris]|uniref:DNA-binding protein n=1 Tax=Paraburkholderia nemoris TaxID=2793076 RepID=UPI00190E0214|nr:DNA-binding protein [Paraburkholderia nemoris]MBK3745173.1 DNA-binding protein [Paraburkholderia aspalathi]CAE6855866.1 hypothetical protein R69619_07686 [Paraburkholderia nemoris]
MNTIPDGNAELKFQKLVAKLTTLSAWTEKQQLELEMACDLSVALRQAAETMREEGARFESYTVMLEYARVLEFMMTMLSGHKDIHPRTLRTIFRFSGLHVDEAYPE